MDLGTLRPLLTTLALPPLALLLLALLGVLLAFKWKRRGLALTTLALVVLWALSCHGMAVWLARHALPQFAPLSTTALKTGKVQAIVILGGGLLPEAPEYGQPQPTSHTANRLRYGIWLARQSGLPVAFTGGIGWAAEGVQHGSEAEAAARIARLDYGVTLRWLESQARDTTDNARLLAPMLRRDGVQRIALVTDAWHMPRAVAAFKREGLTVVAAPMGYVIPVERRLLEWLPSAYGLLASRAVLREWLALAASRIIPV